jgi:hypothetical protein
MLVNSRPAFKGNGTVQFHFRGLEGQPAEVNLTSAVPGRSIKRMVKVTTTGKQIGQALTLVSLKPHEVKFIEPEFTP